MHRSATRLNVLNSRLSTGTMEKVRIPDDGGNIMTCIRLNGFLFPDFADTRGMQGLKNIKIKDDDIIVCSYPKSGTHWVYEMAREILSGEIIDDDITMAATFLEMRPEESYADFPSPRVLSTHVYLEQLPADVLEKNVKIILVFRNPKDTAVSFYHFSKAIPDLDYNGTWDNFIRPYALGKFALGSWFDWVNNWNKVMKDHPELPVLPVYYDDCKQDQVREMRRVCTFLGVERSDEFLSEVCENTSLNKMRSQKTFRSEAVFRKGVVGDWKNTFTVAQNEWFDQLYQEKMKDNSLAKQVCKNQ